MLSLWKLFGSAVFVGLASRVAASFTTYLEEIFHWLLWCRDQEILRSLWLDDRNDLTQCRKNHDCDGDASCDAWSHYGDLGLDQHLGKSSAWTTSVGMVVWCLGFCWLFSTPAKGSRFDRCLWMRRHGELDGGVVVFAPQCRSLSKWEISRLKTSLTRLNLFVYQAWCLFDELRSWQWYQVGWPAIYWLGRTWSMISPCQKILPKILSTSPALADRDQGLLRYDHLFFLRHAGCRCFKGWWWPSWSFLVPWYPQNDIRSWLLNRPAFPRSQRNNRPRGYRWASRCFLPAMDDSRAVIEHVTFLSSEGTNSLPHRSTVLGNHFGHCRTHVFAMRQKEDLGWMGSRQRP